MSLRLLGSYGSGSSTSGSEISDSENEAEHRGDQSLTSPSSPNSSTSTAQATRSHDTAPSAGAAESQLGSASGSASGSTVARTKSLTTATQVAGSPKLLTSRTDWRGGEEGGQEEEGGVRLRGSSPVSYYGLSGECADSGNSSSCSRSSDDEQREGEERDETRENVRRSPLPLPELDGSDRIVSSVFSNPYREAEEAKLAVLKQHVDLSQHVEPTKKRPKWSKRGKFRDRPRFETTEVSEFPPSAAGGSGDQFWDDRDSPAGRGRERKHRSGVTESLVPPKKFLRTHQKIQSEERPWAAR